MRQILSVSVEITLRMTAENNTAYLEIGMPQTVEKAVRPQGKREKCIKNKK